MEVWCNDGAMGDVSPCPVISIICTFLAATDGGYFGRERHGGIR